MSAMGSQITSLTIVYSSVYSDADQRKHQSSASMDFVRGINRSPANSPHKGPVTWTMSPFDEVIMAPHYGIIFLWYLGLAHWALIISCHVIWPISMTFSCISIFLLKCYAVYHLFPHALQNLACLRNFILACNFPEKKRSMPLLLITWLLVLPWLSAAMVLTM